MKRMYALTLIIVAFIIIAGCSDKKNVIGDGSDIVPYMVDIDSDTLFEQGYYYSYEDYTKPFLRNTKSLVGNFAQTEFITLLRFGNLPDSGFVITEDPELILRLKHGHNQEGMQLKLGLIKQRWEPLFATWNKAEEEVDWEDDWNDYSTITILDEIEQTVTDADSILFAIPADLMTSVIEGWVKDVPLSYGLALFAAGNRDDNYVELYTRETADGPRLQFDYLVSVADTVSVRYDRMPIYNTFINSAHPVDGYYLENEIKIGNIVPRRGVLKFDLDHEMFANVTDEEHLKKITVNKAELVLFRTDDENEYHFAESLFEIYPYYLLKEYAPDDLSGLPIPAEDIGIISPTFTSILRVDADSVAVNITSIIQSFVSDLKENKGIIITSSLENKDASFVGFYSPDHTEGEKRPYLRIIYTLPFIPER